MILYYNVETTNTGAMQHGVYIGKTAHFGNRKVRHTNRISNPPRSGGCGVHHYKIASQASDYKLIVLAQFPDWLPRLSLNLLISEHCFVSLLDTWNPLVLLPTDNTTKFRGSNDVQSAIAFSTLARDTFQKIGWPGLTSFHGCNWKTPITEGSKFDATPWTSRLVPDTAEYIPKNNPHGLPATRMRVFYQQPTRTIQSSQKSQSTMVMLLRNQTENSPSLSVTIPKATGITKGTTVQIVCEVMLDGTEHPFPWARFPAIGPFSGWEIINSLGELYCE